MKKKGKKKTGVVVAAAVATIFGVSLAMAGSPQGQKSQQMDSKPGPAFQTIDGKVQKIDGDVYTVEDYNGNQVRLVVGKETKKLRGPKKVGDTVRAEVTRGGFANSIQ
jgi:hypothetical protein